MSAVRGEREKTDAAYLWRTNNFSKCWRNAMIPGRTYQTWSLELLPRVLREKWKNRFSVLHFTVCTKCRPTLSHTYENLNLVPSTVAWDRAVGLFYRNVLRKSKKFGRRYTEWSYILRRSNSQTPHHNLEYRTSTPDERALRITQLVKSSVNHSIGVALTACVFETI